MFSVNSVFELVKFVKKKRVVGMGRGWLVGNSVTEEFLYEQLMHTFDIKMVIFYKLHANNMFC